MSTYQTEVDALKAEVAALQTSADLRRDYERVHQRLKEWITHAQHHCRLNDEELTKVNQAMKMLNMCLSCHNNDIIASTIEVAEAAITLCEAVYSENITEEKVKIARHSDGNHSRYLIGDCVESTLPPYVIYER